MFLNHKKIMENIDAIGRTNKIKILALWKIFKIENFLVNGWSQKEAWITVLKIKLFQE